MEILSQISPVDLSVVVSVTGGGRTVMDHPHVGYQVRTTVTTARQWDHRYCCPVATAAVIAAVVVIVVVGDPVADHSSYRGFPHCWFQSHH